MGYLQLPCVEHLRICLKDKVVVFLNFIGDELLMSCMKVMAIGFFPH